MDPNQNPAQPNQPLPQQPAKPPVQTQNIFTPPVQPTQTPPTKKSLNFSILLIILVFIVVVLISVSSGLYLLNKSNETGQGTKSNTHSLSSASQKEKVANPPPNTMQNWKTYTNKTFSLKAPGELAFRNGYKYSSADDGIVLQNEKFINGVDENAFKTFKGLLSVDVGDLRAEQVDCKVAADCYKLLREKANNSNEKAKKYPTQAAQLGIREVIVKDETANIAGQQIKGLSLYTSSSSNSASHTTFYYIIDRTGSSPFALLFDFMGDSDKEQVKQIISTFKFNQ